MEDCMITQSKAKFLFFALFIFATHNANAKQDLVCSGFFDYIDCLMRSSSNIHCVYPLSANNSKCTEAQIIQYISSGKSKAQIIQMCTVTKVQPNAAKNNTTKIK